MTWFKVDDKSAFHEKVLAAGDAAWGLLCRAGAWSSGQSTDGRIPPHVAKLLCPSRARWDALIAARLVYRLPDGGYEIHDFLEWNPSASQVNAKREARAAAGQRGGIRSGEVRSKGEAIASPTVEAPRFDANEPPSRPVPTRPVPEEKKSSIAPSAATVPAPKVKRDPKPRPEAPPPHPRHGEVVAAYFESFERVRGSKPVFAALEGRHVKTLLEKLSGDADRAIALIRAAFDGDPFLARAATIETIARDPSKYLGSKAPQRSAPWKPPVQPHVPGLSRQIGAGTTEPEYDPNPELCP